MSAPAGIAARPPSAIGGRRVRRVRRVRRLRRVGSRSARTVAAVALLLAAAAAPAPAQDALPVFAVEVSGASPHSTDGTFALAWRPVDPVDPVERGAVEAAAAAVLETSELSFDIEEVEEDGERFVIQVGRQRQTALSGRDDGTYHYRVRAVGPDGAAGAWSAPVEVRVEHHSLALALTLLGVGAVVFLATAGLVVLGHRRAGAVA